MTKARPGGSSSSEPLDSADSAQPLDAAAESKVSSSSSVDPDATEAMPLNRGYEYVAQGSESTPHVVDAEDDSLAFGLMRNGDVVEKLSREEKRAEKAAAKAAEQERAAQEAAAAQAERDLLAQITGHSAASKPENSLGSKALFVGSAVAAAALIGTAALFLLPSQSTQVTPESAEQEVSSSMPTSESPTETPSSSPEAPTPSFNTQVPVVTELEGEVSEEPVQPGTVEYSVDPAAPASPATPVDAPAEVIPAEESAPIEQPENPETVEEVPLAPTAPTGPSAPADLVAPDEAELIEEPERQGASEPAEGQDASRAEAPNAAEPQAAETLPTQP